MRSSAHSPAGLAIHQLIIAPARAVFGKLRKFTALGATEKTMVIYAWFYLGWMRATVLATSLKRATAALEHHREPMKPLALAPDQLALAAQTGRLVAAAARCTPWRSRCLVQVLVTQRILAKRGIVGQICLGVRRDRDSAGMAGAAGTECTEVPAGFSAHAWLQCGDQIVNGAAGHENFTVVSTFRWGGLGAGIHASHAPIFCARRQGAAQ